MDQQVLPSYQSYKDTDLPWLERIPSHWELVRKKYIFKERVQKGFPEEPLLAATQSQGVVRKTDYEARTVEASKDFHLLKLVKEGDFVISLRSFEGGIEYAYHQGIISPAYTVLIPRNRAEASYHKHLLKSQSFIQGLRLFVTGIREGQNIDYTKLSRAELPCPPADECGRIANFLDQKTAEIDEAIANKQRLIVLLKEQKAILINQAVTKGLNPDAPMRDSGVAWIGDVPSHWDIKRLRVIGFTQNGISAGAEFFGSGFPFVSYGDVYNHRELPRQVNGLAKSSTHDRIQYSVERGDVFFTRTSETVEEIGFSSTCMETIENATFAGFLIRFRPEKDHLLPEWSKYYFAAQIHRNYFVGEMNLVIRASLGQSLLKGLPVLIPPKEEQVKIFRHLEKVSNDFERSIFLQQQQIEKLNEFKSILISNVVTGKIKL
ncbi:MAG: restriction endonuclease subunit S [Candidatus Sedimenticola sp. (ex Thyasira tokunagai)]